MTSIRSALLIAVLASMPVPGLAQEFPQAPPKLKEAESAGLTRVSTEELKQFLPGKMDAKGPLGRRTKTFKPDGIVDTVGHRGGNPKSGTWRFDEASNTYCHAFQSEGKKGFVDDCFAVFRASDGTHFFDYNVKTGFFEHTWRRVAE